MNLQHLEYFFTIVEYKSISKAAEVLYISQPSLSRILKSIETEMGTQLLRRTAKGVELTEEGEELYIEAKRAVSILNNAKEKINEKKQQRDTLTLYTGLGYLPMDSIREFQRLHTMVSLDYQFVRFDYNSFVFPCDLKRPNTFCILPEPKELPPEENFGLIRFGRMEPVVTVPERHRFNGRGQIQIEELEGETLIVPQEGSTYRYYADEMFEKAGFEPKIEERSVLEEPVLELRKAALQILQTFSKAGYHPSVDPNEFSIEYRDNVMNERGDVTLLYASHQHGSNPAQQHIRINAPGCEKWFYLIWSKKGGWTRAMEEFARSISNS